MLKKDKSKGHTNNEAVKIQIDTNNSLQRSNYAAAAVIDQGNGVLQSLSSQSETMKVISNC